MQQNRATNLRQERRRHFEKSVGAPLRKMKRFIHAVRPTTVMKTSAAFSWVELLAVIAVLWIVAVVAIPNLPVLVEGRRMARSQRNAMALAELSLAAKSSGHPGWSNRSEAVRELLSGVAVTNPAATNIVIRFQSASLTAEELQAAAEYLSSDGKTLIYIPNGGQPTNF
jgi:type II secretory pathway pseudopilin PulG